MSDIRLQLKHNSRHIAVQRRNLVYVCRLAVKSLIDKACFEPIEEDCEELLNFCAVMEHVLNYRLKQARKWYGSGEKTFWDYVKSATRKLPHNCIASIENVEVPKTAKGKGRAWLRMALMEKRLGEYLTTAIQETRLTRSHYQEAAIMLTEEGQMIAGLLLGLNAIDFSFDIRAENLDVGITPAIDFTPYLKFEQSPESICDDERELEVLSHMSGSMISDMFEEEEGDDLKTRYLKMDEKCKLLSEQKGYMEELVRLRENQLEDVQRQRQKLIDTLHHYEVESRRERQQLEAVIIELQAQLQNVKESHRVERQQMQTLVRRYSSQPPTINQPEIALMDMSTIPPTPAPPDLQSQCSTDSPSISVHRACQTSVDSRSIMSGSSTVSASKDDTQSMVPLAGSFTSEVSFRTSEMALQAAAAGQVQDQGSNSENAGEIQLSKATPKIEYQGNILTVQPSPEYIQKNSADKKSQIKNNADTTLTQTKGSDETPTQTKESDETPTQNVKPDETPKPDLVAGCEDNKESQAENPGSEPEDKMKMESIDLDENATRDETDPNEMENDHKTED